MLALTSTVRGLDHNFEDWLKIYIRLGVERFYLYLDSPSEDEKFFEKLNPLFRSKIELFFYDDLLHESYKRIPEYDQFKDDLDRKVVFRQCLNVHLSLENAIADKVDWLIHVDADELIAFPKGPRCLKSFLGALPEEIDSYIFPTMEALPEELVSRFCFRDVRYFKISPYLLGFHMLDRLMHGWRERGGKFPLFNAHIHGKSAFRVSKYNEAFTPYSVHEFVPYRWSSQSVKVAQSTDEPFLFHFPFIGMDAFRNRFSGFNTNRINTYDKGIFSYNFYEDVIKRLEKGEGLQAIYEERIMCKDDFEYLLNYGYLLKMNFPEHL